MVCNQEIKLKGLKKNPFCNVYLLSVKGKEFKELILFSKFWERQQITCFTKFTFRLSVFCEKARSKLFVNGLLCVYEEELKKNTFLGQSIYWKKWQTCFENKITSQSSVFWEKARTLPASRPTWQSWRSPSSSGPDTWARKTTGLSSEIKQNSLIDCFRTA